MRPINSGFNFDQTGGQETYFGAAAEGWNSCSPLTL